MRAIELTKCRGEVKAKSSLSARGTIRKAQSRDFQSTSHRWEYAEHKCWDPKDGELCLSRMKWEEALGGKSFSVALFGFGIQSGQDLVPWPRPGLLPPALRCREAS